MATAGALANTIREQGQAEIHVIGPKAVNQAIKAVAIARGYLASSGIDLILVPSFVDVTIDGEPRTAIKLLVKPRNPLPEQRPPEEGALQAQPSAEPVAVPKPAEVEGPAQPPPLLTS